MLHLISILFLHVNSFHDSLGGLVDMEFLLDLVIELVLDVVLLVHFLRLHLGHCVGRFFGAVVGLIHTLLLVSLVQLARQVIFDLLLEE